jgi:hypothetical protein
MKRTEPDFVLLTTPPGLYLITCTPSELTELGWSLQQSEFANGVVRTIRGSKMKTVDSLFDEFAAALQFPHYFGENWNALDECLTDLDWLSGDSYLLLVADAPLVLTQEDPGEFAAFVKVVIRAAKEWAGRRIGTEPWDRPQTPFYVVLQCLETQSHQLEQRVRDAGGEMARTHAFSRR